MSDNGFVKPRVPRPLRGRILVTGGAGFIGSALVWALNGRGYDDIVIADFLGTSEKWRNLVPLRFVEYLEADDLVQRIERSAGSLGNVTCVIHMGACSATTETNAAYLVANNVEYTKRLATWAVGRDARFLYASSAATYGSRERDLREDLDPIALRPLNMYGYSKHMVDMWAARQNLLDTIVGVKFFNIYGPNEQHKGDMRSLVSKAVDQIQATGSLRLFKSHRADFADGEQERDFLYVKDAVAMVLHLLEHRARGIFNIGSGEANTWLSLAQAVFAAMDRPAQIEFVDMPEQLRDKYQYSTLATIDRLRESGYAASVTPLADAIADYVRGYLLSDRRLGDEALRLATT